MTSLWTRTPVLASVMIAAAIHGLAVWLGPTEQEMIVVKARTVHALTERRADQLGRDLTPDERDAAIRAFLDDEIVIREAYRRGLHLTNGSIRRRLLQKMRVALYAEVPQPTPATLRAYFNANSARYRIPETVVLGHVYFDSLPAEQGSALLAALEQGADFTRMGQRFWLGPVLGPMTREQLTGALGTGFATAVWQERLGTWLGPITSNRGTHFVQVLERREPTLPEFANVAERVELEWLTEKRIDVTERKVARIQARYRIDIEGRE